MPIALSLRKLNDVAWVRPEALNVAPELLGMPLAPHGRRALAMGVDLAVIGALSSTGEFWIVAGVAALVVHLRRRQPGRTWRRLAWMWLALALLAFVGVRHATQLAQRELAPAAAQAKAQANDDDGDDDAPASAAKISPSLAADIEALRADAADHEAKSAARIAQLEAELAEARKPRPVRWRDEFTNAVRAVGRGFGWAVAYFTLLPFWWQGRTIGKGLFRLRVVELTGKPLGLMNTFGRYGGYAAAMATGGAGFAQVLWDPNRQAIEDKLAHTVVIDLRGPRASVPAAAPAIGQQDAQAAIVDVPARELAP